MLTPYGKLAERYSDNAKFLKFYGNANENTKSLFRDRLKARATPTLCFFTSDGAPQQRSRQPLAHGFPPPILLFGC